jgi:SulP family sulfate permease
VRTTRPHTAILGRVPGTHAYRNIENFPDAEVFPGLLAVRMDAQAYFGNVNFLKSSLTEFEEQAGYELRAVLIDASSMNQLDSSAETALQEIASAYRDRDIELFFAHVKGPVLEVMQRSQLYEMIGDEHIFLTVDDAITFLRERGYADAPVVASNVYPVSEHGEGGRDVRDPRTGSDESPPEGDAARSAA